MLIDYIHNTTITSQTSPVNNEFEEKRGAMDLSNEELIVRLETLSKRCTRRWGDCIISTSLHNKKLEIICGS